MRSIKLSMRYLGMLCALSNVYEEMIWSDLEYLVNVNLSKTIAAHTMEHLGRVWVGCMKGMMAE